MMQISTITYKASSVQRQLELTMQNVAVTTLSTTLSIIIIIMIIIIII